MSSTMLKANLSAYGALMGPPAASGGSTLDWWFYGSTGELPSYYSGGRKLAYPLNGTTAATSNDAYTDVGVFLTLSSGKKSYIEGVLQNDLNFVDLAFQAGSSASSADLKFAAVDKSPYAQVTGVGSSTEIGAWTYDYSSGNVTNAIAGSTWFTNFGTPSNVWAKTVRHEIGHSLGLADTSIDARMSIMSDGLLPNADNAEVFQILDIAALQDLYGSAAANTGSTTYNNSHFDSDRYWSIWDSDGASDLIDASALTGSQYIDLRPGYFSSLGNSPGVVFATPTTFSDFGVQNTSIAFGSNIEHASGGGSADLIVGNGFSNVLIGNNGADVIYGDGTAFTAGATDADYVHITQSGPVNDTLDFTDQVDVLIGGQGDDYLFGGLGVDILIGGSGANRLNGGNGADFIMVTSDENTIRGGKGDDLIDLSTGGEGSIGPTHNTIVFGKGDGHDIVLFSGRNKAWWDDDYNWHYEATNSWHTMFEFPDVDYDDLMVYVLLADPFNADDFQVSLTFKILSTGDTIHIPNWSNFFATNWGPEWPQREGETDYHFIEIAGYSWSGTVDLYDLNDSFDSSPFEFQDGSHRVLNFIGGPLDPSPYMYVPTENPIDGTPGGDTLGGTPGSDAFSGGNGNDTFQSSALFGGGGYDAFDGGSGTDTIEARGDNEIILASSIEGVEQITAGGFSGVSLKFGIAGVNIDLSGVTLTGISRIEGSSMHDVIVASNGNDVLVGGAGDDTLFGQNGDDTFVLGINDGVEQIDGGNGNDTILVAGDDAVIIVQSLSGVEIITANGHSNISLRGTDRDDLIDLSGSVLIGISPVILAGRGEDVIFGSDAAETIVGGGGGDTLSGGGGNDVFLLDDSSPGQDSYDGGLGYDEIRLGEDWTEIAIRSISGVELINGNGFEAAYIYLHEDAGVLDLSGVELVGIEEIDGSWSTEVIIGSAGDDRIYGGEGDDTLAGGAGNDTFGFWSKYDLAGYSKIIQDFVASSDVLDLHGVDADSTTSGNQDFSFIGAALFSSTPGELRQYTSGSDTILEGDFDGDGLGDFEIAVLGAASLSGSDFWL